MQDLALVALGGALGASLRYAAGRGLARLGGAFPLATLCVNVAGCFAIGLVLAWLERSARSGALGPERAGDVRLFVVVGLLGGLTTFSAFGQETVTLLRGGAWSAGLLSIALNLGLGFGAVLLGVRVGS